MRASIWVAATLALAGCKSTPENGFAVDVTVTVDQSVNAAALSSIRALDVDVSGAETFHTSYPIATQLMSREAKFIYRPRATAGTVAFTVRGLDGAGTTIASGQATTSLKNGETVTVSLTLHAFTPMPDMSELPDMSMPDMTCVPETDSEFCARVTKNCEAVSANDNCGMPRMVASCGTCPGATPACVNNVCKAPVCGTSFVASGTVVTSASQAAIQDDLLGASATGDTLLLLRPTGTCTPSVLFIADAVTAGSMASYSIQGIGAQTGLSTIAKVEETMTITGDGLTIIGIAATGSNKFLASSRSALNATDFSTAAEGAFATINANIPAGGTLLWPVISADGLAFYYRVGGATTATNNGIYESLRTTTAASFPAATKMAAAVQAFDAVTGISSDHMTLFVTAPGSYATSILNRFSVTQPFATPSPAAMPPGAAWRTTPIANCTKVIGTCEPGACANEDICVWAKM